MDHLDVIYGVREGTLEAHEDTLRDQFAMACPEPPGDQVIKFLQQNFPEQAKETTHQQWEEAVCILRYIRADAMLEARKLTPSWKPESLTPPHE